jgi:VWFA-related protein
MREAIRISIEHLNRKAKHDKKVILVITDGNDNASRISLPALVRQAQQNDVLIYAIGLLAEEEKKEAALAKRALNQLVESTGGQVFYPRDVSEVERLAHEVAHDIRNQYTITYSPSNQTLDGSFRQIRVAVKGPESLVARTRQGYYATKETAAGGKGS